MSSWTRHRHYRPPIPSEQAHQLARLLARATESGTAPAASTTGKKELTGIASDLIDSYTDRLNSVDSQGVFRNALVMLILCVGGIFVYFALLRPNLPGTLAPKTRIQRRVDTYIEKALSKTTTRADQKYFPRIAKAIEEFQKKLGRSEGDHLLESFDQVAYLRLLWLCLEIFVVVSIVTIPILVPVDWRAHHKDIDFTGDKAFSNVSLTDFTINGVEGKHLYFHVVEGYVIGFVVCLLIWWNSRVLSRLRVEFFIHPSCLVFPEKDAFKRCVLITDIGPTSVARVLKRIQARKESIKELADVPHVAYVFEERDPETRLRRAREFKEALEGIERSVTNAVRNGKKTDVDPLMRAPGLLGIARPKQPALKYWTDKILRTWKIRLGRTMRRYAIVGFPSAGQASLFIRHSNFKASATGLWRPEIDFAPMANGIIWDNMKLDSVTRGVRWLAGYAFLSVLLVVYVPPLAGIALLSNIGAVTQYSDTLKEWENTHKTFFAILTTTVPPALSAALFAVLPRLIYYIAYLQGSKTSRSLQARIINWLLFFMIIAQLVLFPSLSTIFTLATTKVSAGQSILFFLKTMPLTYQQQANYWLNWLAMRWFIVVIQLAQTPVLVKTWLLRLYRHLTARERELPQALPAQYEIHIPNALFIVALGLVYAPLVPFVSVFASVALLLLYVIHKVQASLLFRTESETSGKFWLPEMDRILVFSMLSQGLLGLTVGLQGSDVKIGLMIAPAVGLTAIFRFWLRAKYNPTLDYMLHPNAFKQTSDDLDLEHLKQSFGFSVKVPKLHFDDEIKDAAEKMLVDHRLSGLLESPPDAEVNAPSKMKRITRNVRRRMTATMPSRRRKKKEAATEASTEPIPTIPPPYGAQLPTTVTPAVGWGQGPDGQPMLVQVPAAPMQPHMLQVPGYQPVPGFAPSQLGSDASSAISSHAPTYVTLPPQYPMAAGQPVQMQVPPSLAGQSDMTYVGTHTQPQPGGTAGLARKPLTEAAMNRLDAFYNGAQANGDGGGVADPGLASIVNRAIRKQQ